MAILKVNNTCLGAPLPPTLPPSQGQLDTWSQAPPVAQPQRGNRRRQRRVRQRHPACCSARAPAPITRRVTGTVAARHVPAAPGCRDMCGSECRGGRGMAARRTTAGAEKLATGGGGRAPNGSSSTLDFAAAALLASSPVQTRTWGTEE